MAANTVTDIINADARASVEGNSMSLELIKPDETSEKILRGLELHLTELSKQYPKNIRIIYGGVKNA